MEHKMKHSEVVEAIVDWLAKKGIEESEENVTIKAHRGGKVTVTVEESDAK